MIPRERLATTPISWGVVGGGRWGVDLPTDRVLDEMSDLGFSACEIGVPSFLPDDVGEARAAARPSRHEGGGRRAVGRHARAVRGGRRAASARQHGGAAGAARCRRDDDGAEAGRSGRRGASRPRRLAAGLRHVRGHRRRARRARAAPGAAPPRRLPGRGCRRHGDRARGQLGRVVLRHRARRVGRPRPGGVRRDVSADQPLPPEGRPARSRPGHGQPRGRVPGRHPPGGVRAARRRRPADLRRSWRPWPGATTCGGCSSRTRPCRSSRRPARVRPRPCVAASTYLATLG